MVLGAPWPFQFRNSFISYFYYFIFYRNYLFLEREEGREKERERNIHV